MEISLLTPKCTLVPANFFDPSTAREALAEVIGLDGSDTVSWVAVPQYDAVLVYCDRADDTVTKTISESNGQAGQNVARPESFYILRDLQKCVEYNKILCSWQDSMLFLAIAQGKSLLLTNVFSAPDFTTAEYYIFLAMKSLQLNPEVSTICWRSRIGAEEEMSLYRYFKAVETL